MYHFQMLCITAMHAGEKLRPAFWKKNRLEIFASIPEHHRTKFDEAHAMLSEFEAGIASDNEKERCFTISLSHFSQVLYQGLWEADSYANLVHADDPGAIALLPILTAQTLRSSKAGRSLKAASPHRTVTTRE